VVEENLRKLVWLFFVSLVSLSSFRFSAPFSFSLCSYTSSAGAVLGDSFCLVLVHVLVNGWIVNLVLLESSDVLV